MRLVGRVAVVGVAQTRHEERKPNLSFSDLIYEVTSQALRDSGLTKDDVETVIEAGSDYWDGRGCSNIHTVMEGGAYLKEESKVEEDAIFAFTYAYLRILSGHFETALVFSYTKPSESRGWGWYGITHLMSDPIYERSIGLDIVSTAAMQAQLYVNRYGDVREQAAMVASRNLKNALNNPYSHRRVKASVEDILRSPVLAYPLRELDCCPVSDGACAIILASEEKAKKITDNPAWVKGVGWCMDEHSLGDRDLLNIESLKVASRMAYKRAGIEYPRRQLDVIEPYNPFTYQELLWYENLDLCKAGEAARLVEEGVTDMSGELPVSPSGGLLSTNPVVASGLVRVAEAAIQVMGRAERRQVPDAETALAHGAIGYCGQSHCVVILGR